MVYYTVVNINTRVHIPIQINLSKMILSKRSNSQRNTFYVTSFELQKLGKRNLRSYKSGK